MDIDTTVKNWFLVDFTHHKKRLHKKVLWGIVVRDQKGRWHPGDWCCTSLVLEEKRATDGPIFVTQNSVYKTLGDGKRLEAPASSLQLLRSGYSPDQWETIAALRVGS